VISCVCGDVACDSSEDVDEEDEEDEDQDTSVDASSPVFYEKNNHELTYFRYYTLLAIDSENLNTTVLRLRLVGVRCE